MKHCFTALLFFAVIVSCIQHQSGKGDEQLFPEQEKVEVHHAAGFEVQYENGYTAIITHSIGSNEPFSDTVYLKTSENAVLPKDAKVLAPYMPSIVCQSTTHLAFLDVLGEVGKVSAICGLDYVQNGPVRDELALNGALELCLAENIEMETLLKVNPDLFLMYPFGTEGNSKYRDKGVNTLYIAEYLEEDQLARLEWIKLFGLLFGKAKEANAYFDRVSGEYLSLKQEPDTNKKFFLNLPYEGSWFMPSANSQTVRIMEDAGLSYFYEGTGATENDVHSTEEVWNDAMEVDYWVIIASRPADFSLADLVAEEAVYAKFKSVIHNQVIFCNTTTCDYFAQGVVEPDVMIRDLLFAAHKIDDHQPKYFFLLK